MCAHGRGGYRPHHVEKADGFAGNFRLPRRCPRMEGALQFHASQTRATPVTATFAFGQTLQSFS
jgi:hypothetical protein